MIQDPGRTSKLENHRRLCGHVEQDLVSTWIQHQVAFIISPCQIAQLHAQRRAHCVLWLDLLEARIGCKLLDRIGLGAVLTGEEGESYKVRLDVAGVLDLDINGERERAEVRELLVAAVLQVADVKGLTAVCSRGELGGELCVVEAVAKGQDGTIVPLVCATGVVLGWTQALVVGSNLLGIFVRVPV